MKQFNSRIFAIALAFFIMILPFSFLAAYAQDEGTLGDGFILNFVARSFYILRFPLHTLLFDIFSEHSGLFFGGLLLNLFFHAFVIERCYYLISFWKQKQKENT